MDNPSVNLISILPNAEKIILYCARASSNQDNTSTGLLKFLIRQKHWSPFEMAFAVFEINTSRGIAAQILRHRSFSFQEFSQRYADPTHLGYEPYKARRQADKNRQSSVDDLSKDQIAWWYEIQEETWETAISNYNKAIANGIAKESARFILPLNVKTKLYMAGTIRSWIHYCNLRTQDDVQLEHRVLAQGIKEILTQYLPTIAEALEWV